MSRLSLLLALTNNVQRRLNGSGVHLDMVVFVISHYTRHRVLIIITFQGQPTPKNGGFHLGGSEEVVLDLPQKWSGRLWGRQGCSFDAKGKGSCDTGDCSGLLHCQGTGGAPPATVVEMTLGSSTSPLHFYDVSLVDGFNLPVSMKPVGGGIGCGIASCEVDLNVCCPSTLEVKKGDKVIRSSGKYKSIEHRAVTNKSKARISYATFFFPHDAVEIEPLAQMESSKSSHKMYKRIKYGDH
ncbi:Pathogenesis-related thaumatin superfamily protein [Tripterygium wilfordii]|uniref:Pathogenesis-related thaumatin superfamily protein n=1 Tax=Tripterygium wilfordii TaxID=458696 RepID=A0A7J7CT84_TRIWF|nr:Pathogenesis-related thaumatin superfamily protein [Tripterygium wilfordii]